MSESIAFLNGDFLPLSEAKISVLDRGFIFGDGIYEVIPAYAGRLFRLDEHLQRLQNSLAAVRIVNPYSDTEWKRILDTLLEKNPADDASIYLQVTRGVAKRDHAFPPEARPTVFAMANPLVTPDEATFSKGVAAITLDDIRWQYCNIKAITLLPNILLRQAAVDANAAEAILVRNGDVTEGAASNIFIVSQGVIRTPPKSELLLPGITRDLIVELAHANGLAIEETTITRPELDSADEIWLTSSTKEIMPVLRLDESSVGDGKPGPITHRMFAIFQTYKQQLRQAAVAN